MTKVKIELELNNNQWKIITDYLNYGDCFPYDRIIHNKIMKQLNEKVSKCQSIKS